MYSSLRLNSRLVNSIYTWSGVRVRPYEGTPLFLTVENFTGAPAPLAPVVPTPLKNNWSELPKCPNCDFSLAMVNNLLTAIGGTTPNGDQCTSSLLSFTDMIWTERFPPMPTKRWLTAVVCCGRSLMVAGGIGEGFKNLSTVEVMDTETLQWSTASSLPHPLHQATATLCGYQIYMLGGFYRSNKSSKSVFTCSLTALLQSFQSKSGSLGTQMKTLSLASGPKVWRQLANIPVVHSVCASLHGHLVAVGGDDPDGKTTAIHMYNTTTNSLEAIREKNKK